MFTRLKGEKIYCGVDIGLRKIKTALVKIDGQNKPEMLGAFEQDLRGFREQSVIDLGEMVQSVQTTIQELVRRTSVKVKDVYLGVNSELIEARPTQAVIPLMDKGQKLIGPHDVKKANLQAHLLGLKMDEEILHELPQSYTVDDVNAVLNPYGLYGRKLGVNSLLIVTNVNRLRNLSKAINQAGYNVAQVYFSSFVAGFICLTEQERADGSILIDVGSRVTSVLIFKDRVLKSLDKIDLGGDHFTKAIASQLNLPFDLAEEIKKSYAVASRSDQDKDEEILIKKEDKYLPIKARVICQSIEQETKRLTDEIIQALQKSSDFVHINRGLVLIGGGALLPGLIEQIGSAANRPARLGSFNNLIQRGTVNAALFSSSVGLAQQGYYKNWGSQSLTAPRMSWPKRIVQQVGELYQEYF